MDKKNKSTEENIPHPHDKFFKMAMSDKRVAREFFQAHLPAEILEVIDLDYLELQPGSYIDDLRQETIADMLFKTRIGDEEAYLYLIVDHQSQPDELMPFRTLKYTCNVIDQTIKIKNTKRIPLILPLVIYHGKDSWAYSTDIRDMVDAPRHLVDNYFLKPFFLIDLNRIEDQVLKQRTWLGVMELTLKHIFARDMLPHLKDIIELLQYLERENGKVLAETVLIYIVDRGKIDDKKAFVELIKTKLSKELGEKVMTIAELFKDEGRQEGIEQGIIRGRLETAQRLLKEGIDLAFIVKITGLSIERINDLALL